MELLMSAIMPSMPSIRSQVNLLIAFYRFNRFSFMLLKMIMMIRRFDNHIEKLKAVAGLLRLKQLIGQRCETRQRSKFYQRFSHFLLSNTLKCYLRWQRTKFGQKVWTNLSKFGQKNVFRSFVQITQIRKWIDDARKLLELNPLLQWIVFQNLIFFSVDWISSQLF